MLLSAAVLLPLITTTLLSACVMKPFAREVCGCARHECVDKMERLHVYVVLHTISVRYGDVFVVVV